MAITKELVDFSIVLVGEMYPTLFTPFWLNNHNLIKEKEAEGANINVVSPNLTRYEISDWARFEITTNRIIIHTFKESHYEVIRDISISFLKALSGNDITNLGINHSHHYQLDRERYIKIGDILAPFSNWENIFSNPKLLSLEMIQEERKDEYNGRYRVRVQPSSQIEENGVNININNHFNRTGESKNSSTEIEKILRDVWSNSHSFSESVISNFWDNIQL